MVYPVFGVIIAFSFLIIIRNRDASSSCPARIEALFIVFSAFMLSLIKAIDRFSVVFSASARSLF